MTVETITRGEWSCDLLYGYGRLLRARSILVRNVPESVRRAQIVNPDADAKELKSKVSAEEIVETGMQNAIELAKLVLNRATDWDKSKLSIEEYVDGYLPPDVGDEIVLRITNALSAFQPIPDKKKDS